MLLHIFRTIAIGIAKSAEKLLLLLLVLIPICLDFALVKMKHGIYFWDDLVYVVSLVTTYEEYYFSDF